MVVSIDLAKVLTAIDGMDMSLLSSAVKSTPETLPSLDPKNKVLASQIPDEMLEHFKRISFEKDFQTKNKNIVLFNEKNTRAQVLKALVSEFLHEPGINTNAKTFATNKEALENYMKVFEKDPESITDAEMPTLDSELIDSLLYGSKYNSDKTIVDETSLDQDTNLYGKIQYKKAVTESDLEQCVQSYGGKIKRDVHNLAVVYLYMCKLTKTDEKSGYVVNLFDLFYMDDIVKDGSLLVPDGGIKEWEVPVVYRAIVRNYDSLNLKSSVSVASIETYQQKFNVLYPAFVATLETQDAKKQINKFDQLLQFHNKYNDQKFGDLKDITYEQNAAFKTVITNGKFNLGSSKIRRHSLPYDLKQLYAELRIKDNQNLDWMLNINITKINIFMYAAKFGLDPYSLYYENTVLPNSVLSGDKYLTYIQFRNWEEFISKFNDKNKIKSDTDLVVDDKGSKVSKNCTMYQMYCRKYGQKVCTNMDKFQNTQNTVCVAKDNKPRWRGGDN